MIDYNLNYFFIPPLPGNTAYGDTGTRDVHLAMSNVRLDGRKGILHFIRFPTADMDKFILLCKSKNLKSVARTICATGFWAGVLIGDEVL